MARSPSILFIVLPVSLALWAACGPVDPTSSDPEASTTATAAWKNSLGMEFQPVPEAPGVLIAIWETRVRDFAAFVEATGHDATERFYYYKDRTWNTGGRYWRDPGFDQTDRHPVVGVSWRDAAAFCLWLTDHERKLGVITGQQAYRLPSNQEWSLAAGAVLESPSLPFNYANYHTLLDVDTYEYTSPVGSFPPNEHGLYDMAGNAWEYCLDLESPRDNFRVIRGGCWQNWHTRFIGVQARGFCGPDVRITLYGFRVVLAGNDEQVQSMQKDIQRVDPPPEIILEW